MGGQHCLQHRLCRLVRRTPEAAVVREHALSGVHAELEMRPQPLFPRRRVVRARACQRRECAQSVEPAPRLADAVQDKQPPLGEHRGMVGQLTSCRLHLQYGPRAEQRIAVATGQPRPAQHYLCLCQCIVHLHSHQQTVAHRYGGIRRQPPQAGIRILHPSTAATPIPIRHGFRPPCVCSTTRSHSVPAGRHAGWCSQAATASR